MKGSSEERPEKRLVIVDIIKAVSCIMIFLYHCNTILPGEWKFLTLFGQDLGNNLFFYGQRLCSCAVCSKDSA